MTNPLLDTDRLPAFSRILPEHVEPAVDRVLTENRARVSELLALNGAMSWSSLVEPMEAMDHRLGRVWSPVGHLNAVMNTDALRQSYHRCLPKLTEYSTEMGQNEALYDAYRTVAENDAELGRAERQVLRNALRDFRLAGVALAPEDKAQFRDVMQELAKLSARFEENVLDATNAWSRHVTDPAEIRGLPEGLLERAREAAAAKDKEGWLFCLDFPNFHSVLSYAEDRGLRREFYEAWCTRASDQGPNAGRWDNGPLMTQILALRLEAARLIGFDSYAEMSLATKMAGSVGEVMGFLEELAEKSRPAALAELAEVEAYAGMTLEAWDIPFWSERLRKERFDVSDEALRPWFPLERVLDGLFKTTGRLFGFEVRPVENFDSWHESVRFYELVRPDGEVLGAFYVDLYARASKRGGAWMDDCVGRMDLGGHRDKPVAYLVCNFMPPVGSKPAMLTHNEVVTLFHEFGHTLHHLLTRVGIPSVAGINGVAWDAVELPSQFLENFAWQPEVLEMISGHVDTGEPLPGEMLDKLLGTRSFQAAMQMVRQLEFALFDFRLHASRDELDAEAQAAMLTAVRRQVAVVPYPDFNRFPASFSHIFGGGYAAGYYSYKWAEVLAADAFSAFEDTGIFDAETGERFLTNVLEVGGSVDAMDAFVAFRGRKPETAALLRQAGIGT